MLGQGMTTEHRPINRQDTAHQQTIIPYISNIYSFYPSAWNPS